MKDTTCAYCMHNDPVHGDLEKKFAWFVTDLPTCHVYIFKEQTHKGRALCAYKEHVSEMVNISDEERNAFIADCARVAKAMHAAFHPDKINYGMYGDTGCHLHMHLCPKYRDEAEWGSTFEMNPQKVFLSDAEYEALAQQLLEHL